MKKIILILMSLVLLVSLAGCASTNAGNVVATPSPMVTMKPTTMPTNTPSPMVTPSMMPTTMPDGTGMPQTTAGAVAGVSTGTTTTMSVDDAHAMNTKISKEVERLSEVKAAQTVVMGDTAIVAIEFDPQYKGEMTTRITDMVETRVMNVDKNIKKVNVTSDTALGAKVKNMGERLSAGTVKTVDEISADFKALMSEIMPVR